MVNFAQMKKNRKKSISALSDELNKMSNKKGGDDRFWQPTVDKVGNGSAIIRFLPAPAKEEVPFVRVWSHFFKGPGGSAYYENSRTTIGESDPVADLNSKLWNSGRDADKDVARDQKRKLHFFSNIYVIKDPGNPDNEGKVFLFKYGKKIFDKINDLMNPEFEDETAVNPFDLWEGANFRMKIRQVEGYRNYDKSDFSEPCALSDSDTEMEEIWNSAYSLKELVSPDKFKSYEELEAKLNRVLGSAPVIQRTVLDEVDDDQVEEAPKATRTKPAAKQAADEDDDEDVDIAALLKRMEGSD